jgi:hypothetical protein
MTFVRRQLPVAIFGLCSLFLIVTWFVDYKPLVDFGNRIMQVGTIASAFALTLGAINLIRHHSKHIARKTEGQWIWSAYLLAVFIPLTLWGILYGSQDYIVNWVYQNVNTPLESAMWGILAPYIVSASFRAFKLKNRESLVVTLSCVFVLLMNAPIGEAIWPGFPAIGRWITDNMQTTGVRVFTIGVAIGTLALYIRTLFGRETASLGFGGDGQ